MKEITSKSFEAANAENVKNFIGSAFTTVCYIAAVKAICKLLKLYLEENQIFRAIYCIVMLGLATGLLGAEYIGEWCGDDKDAEQNSAKLAE